MSAAPVKKDASRGREVGPYLAVLPGFLLVAAVIFYPILNTLWLSVHYVELTGVGEFLSLGNYLILAEDPLFWQVLRQTLLWTTASVLIKLILGLVLAILLNEKLRGRNVLRALLLVPWAMPTVAAAIVWRWMYDTNFGYLNDLLLELGIVGSPVVWLGTAQGAFAAAVVTDAWTGLPFMAFVFLTGLQGIDRSLYEAAKIDGANARNRLLYVTLPQLAPVILVATLVSAIWTFNAFNVVYTLTGGGPLNATDIMVTYTYTQAFERLEFGLAAALATITFVILLVFSLLYVGLYGRRNEV
jgi:multiple sugar transport system permease protein